jgi:hypothetical protein
MLKRKDEDNFFTVLTLAINYFAEHGFRTQKDLEYWVKRLKESAEKTLPPARTTEEAVRRQLMEAYRKLITKRQSSSSALLLLLGVNRFTLDRVKPSAKAELERRVLASKNLIKLNREEAISTTLRRFEGWVSSVPTTGAAELDKRDLKRRIRAPIAKMDFLQRRVIRDQVGKFTQAVNSLIATRGKAIAGRWHSRWREPYYDYRKDHKERDELYYTIPDNWALTQGLMKVGAPGYTTDVTQPAEEINCKCSYRYIFDLADLPDDMLTEKGRQSIASKKK